MSEPIVEIDHVTFRYPESTVDVFEDISLELPRGNVSLVGQNGTGKTTLLLLAGGRLMPDTGSVRLLGKPTDTLTDEEERNKCASFVYQNMEFETEEPIASVMRYIYENGNHDSRDNSFIESLVELFELEECTQVKLQSLSKGQMQRAILLFSVLYGSDVILMDEPIFALEDHQKESIMRYLADYAAREGRSLYYSVHELDISRKFSDYVLLFYKNGQVELGTTSEMLTDEKLEQAYELPRAMLRKKEHLYREYLLSFHRALDGTDPRKQ